MSCMWNSLYFLIASILFSISPWLSQKFCNILVVREVQFSSSVYFCQGHEDGEPHWTVICWAHLILSVCNSSDLSLALEFTILRPTESAWSLQP